MAASVHSYTPSDPAISIVGALQLQELGGGAVRPLRLPAKSWGMIPTEDMRAIVATSAGVRVRFVTAATWVGIRLHAHPLEDGRGSSRAAALDLVVDGAVIESRPLIGTSPVEILFERLPSGEKTIELWLPQTAIVDVLEVSAGAPISGAPGPGIRWLHHGSSISHCLEADRPTRTWPALVALERGWDLLDLGFAGNALLDPFVARAIRDEPADLITLKLGINVTTAASMRLRTFAPAVHGFLDTVREGHPETPIVIISPIASPVLEQHSGPVGVDPLTGRIECESDHTAPESLTLQRVRTALSEVVSQRRSSDSRLSYIDGLDLFGEEDARRGLLPDGLHPNTEGYGLMAQRITPLLPMQFP